MKFLSNLDLNKNQLLNARVQNLASAPGSPVSGQIYYDTTDLTLKQYNGTSWIAADASKVADGYIPLAKLATDPLARANHTGTQLASTISNFDTQVRTSRLDQMAAPTASVSMNSQKITNLQDGSAASDAATVGQMNTAIDNAAAGIDSKPSVRVVATTNITLSGLQTIDGISLSANDRVLLTGQTTASQNGVYAASSGAWSRVVDADATGEITPGAFWYVEEGTTYGGSQWRCANTGAITLGSTSITINQWGGGASYTNGDGLDLIGNVFSVKPVASGGISVGASGVQVDTAIVVRKYSATIGDGSTTAIVVTHSLGSKDVQVTVRDAATDDVVEVDWTATSTTQVTLNFATAPSTNSLRVTVQS